MHIREATTGDIRPIQIIRNSVKENVLSDPGLVTDQHCITYITERGKGWVGETNGVISGFSIVDLLDNNVWALFVHPQFEGRGLGRSLHDTMLDWYFEQTSTRLWLSTAPGTRAAHFYRTAGWRETGTYGKGELKFEITSAEWSNRKQP